MISKEIIDKIVHTSKLSEVAADFLQLKKSGKDLHGKCPHCLKEGPGKGMFFDDKKDVFKCFSCQTGGKGSVKFLLETQKMDFIQAIKYLGDKYTIDYNEDEKRMLEQQQAAQRKMGKGKQTFTDIQLHSSGLDAKDVKAKVYRDGDTSKMYDTMPFAPGTLNDYYHLIPGVGNDMIIYYYDLEGHQIMYLPPKRTKLEPFFRVRFQNPDARKDKFKKPIKYYSPPGSGTHLYVPEKIRKMYKNGNHIDTLFVQEGEKKAEKSCKHDIFSVGVMGIHNVGSDNVMPKDLQMLIQKCNVKRIVFMLDSDWQDISINLKSGDNPQRRSWSFFSAVKNFKEYMLSFRNIGINLEIYFGACKKSDKNEKGIDDILAGTFKADEKTFVDDLQATLNSKSGEGKHVDIFKITSLTDYQIKDFWKLNSVSEFAERHKEILMRIPEFSISKTKYRFNEDGKFELAEPILPEEKYWELNDKGKPQFKYTKCYTFLHNRGYGRQRMAGKWKYVHFNNHIATVTDRAEIKYFVTEVTKEIASEDVLDMIYQGGHFYLGEHILENLRFHDIKFETPGKTFQNMHFRNKFIKITRDKVEEFETSQRVESIWQDQIIDFDIDLIDEKLIDFEIVPDHIVQKIESEDMRYHYIDKGNPAYSLKLTPEGQACHFLQFLVNSSNFHHDKTRDISEFLSQPRPNYDAFIDTSMHLLSKLTALGYLCHRFHNASVAKAVIAVDGRLSEVGSSHGRTGKSLFGKALGKIMPQVYIGGKLRNLTEDPFLFEEVNEKTENVFFDDVRTNIDFEFFFPNITGQWKINAKGVGRWTMPDGHPLKMFFSTNHMINGEGSSFTDRMHHIVFSDYYNDTWKPINEFNALFFDEWDSKQWNYFYNLVAISLQLYFRYGLVEAPSRNIEKRRLRQMMGEEFLTWAEEYFAGEQKESSTFTRSNLETKIPRKELFDDFKARLRGKLLDFYSATRFGKCIRWFCQYKGYHFNPHRPNEHNENIKDFLAAGGTVFYGIEDKSSGVEYFTVSKEGTNMPLTKSL
jgi:DNA primase